MIICRYELVHLMQRLMRNSSVQLKFTDDLRFMSYVGGWS